MLSEVAVARFSVLTYRPDAEWEVNILPFGSIYWKDEMPDIRDFIRTPEKDRDQLLRMFSIRLRVWDGEALSDEEQQLWDTIRAQIPQWALFHRLKLSPEDARAREKAERQVEQEFESLSEDETHGG
jgi:hypothetical protein